MLGFIYEERVLAFERALLARWQIAWERNFGEGTMPPLEMPIQPRAVSHRSTIVTAHDDLPVYKERTSSSLPDIGEDENVRVDAA
ncbi:MAG: hypothetical protein FWG82_06010 [Oscillospiraceae bacterium]|nr:hypothetical protein [Oscillospiraceae bacterium]